MPAVQDMPIEKNDIYPFTRRTDGVDQLGELVLGHITPRGAEGWRSSVGADGEVGLSPGGRSITRLGTIHIGARVVYSLVGGHEKSATTAGWRWPSEILERTHSSHKGIELRCQRRRPQIGQS